MLKVSIAAIQMGPLRAAVGCGTVSLGWAREIVDSPPFTRAEPARSPGGGEIGRS